MIAHVMTIRQPIATDTLRFHTPAVRRSLLSVCIAVKPQKTTAADQREIKSQDDLKLNTIAYISRNEELDQGIANPGHATFLVSGLGLFLPIRRFFVPIAESR